MDQTSATSPTAASAPPQQADTQAAAQPVDAGSAPSPPGFGARGRVRRRVRFLRKARELAYRDLGGLVFSLHRFGQRNDSLVLAKLATLSRVDAELRTLESSLSERQPVTVLREAGVTACPRCAAIHSGEDRFCPNCGLSMSRRSDLPIAGVPPAAAPAPATPTAPPAAAPAASGAPPTPPAPAPADRPAQVSGDDQPTEIIRPRPGGS
ncbi:MAG TPA: zinc ribbon domain-containing protein [Solirubrobacteraceae bacterium]|nr:zinc ribbon domain-containing protein [Solirubrobacteraceae bacterium]